MSARSRIEAVIVDLADDTLCAFWACPGPDKPIKPMATCRVCASVIELREILSSKEIDHA